MQKMLCNDVSRALFGNNIFSSEGTKHTKVREDVANTLKISWRLKKPHMLFSAA